MTAEGTVGALTCLFVMLNFIHVETQISMCFQAATFAALIKKMLASETLSEEDAEGCERFLQILHSSGIVDKRTTADDADVEKAATKVSRQSQERMERASADMAQFFARFDGLTRETAAFAVQVTKTAMRAQDAERKSFMNSIRDSLAEKVRAGQAWKEVIDRNTHERAVWHFKEKRPRSVP
jgi:hypothetical protein